MKELSLAFAVFVAEALAQGSGQYRPSTSRREQSLSQHTIYMPSSVPAGVKLPVLAWGNGACSANHNDFVPFLHEVASHGFIVLANGAPGMGGSTNSQWQKNALDWIIRNAGQGAYAAVDTSKIAVGGMSCGGTEAYDFVFDNRVATVGIFNSGLLGNYDMARRITKPMFYFVGGSGDIAYQNFERDYSYLPVDTPRWKGNQNVGHGGTYSQTNGGSFGKAAAHWLKFVLKGDTTSAQWFIGNGASSEGWSVAKGALDRVPTGGNGGNPQPQPTSTTTQQQTQPQPTPTGGNGGGSVAIWGQCGGIGYNGPTTCQSGTCRSQNPYYSQCIP